MAVGMKRVPLRMHSRGDGERSAKGAHPILQHAIEGVRGICQHRVEFAPEILLFLIDCSLSIRRPTTELAFFVILLSLIVELTGLDAPTLYRAETQCFPS